MLFVSPSYKHTHTIVFSLSLFCSLFRFDYFYLVVRNFPYRYTYKYWYWYRHLNNANKMVNFRMIYITYSSYWSHVKMIHYTNRCEAIRQRVKPYAYTRDARIVNWKFACCLLLVLLLLLSLCDFILFFQFFFFFHFPSSIVTMRITTSLFFKAMPNCLHHVYLVGMRVVAFKSNEHICIFVKWKQSSTQH